MNRFIYDYFYFLTEVLRTEPRTLLTQALHPCAAPSPPQVPLGSGRPSPTWRRLGCV